ncbi:hypothetical protein Tco_0361070, partial [Tanacetum coccineum]
VRLQSQPVPPPGQLPRYSGAIDAVKKKVHELEDKWKHFWGVNLVHPLVWISMSLLEPVLESRSPSWPPQVS